jgi:hypothetical protein
LLFQNLLMALGVTHWGDRQEKLIVLRIVFNLIFICQRSETISYPNKIRCTRASKRFRLNDFGTNWLFYLER